MGNEAHTPSQSPLSRRAMLGGIGTAAGALGVGLAARPATAATAPRSPFAARTGVVRNATPLQDGLDYLMLSGYDFVPINSDQLWNTSGGSFRFTNTANDGYCSIRPQLPLGAVVHEIEIYGTTGVGSVSQLAIYTTNPQTGDLVGPTFTPSQRTPRTSR